MAWSGMHRLELPQNASENAEDPLSARQTSAWLTCYLEQLSRPGAALVIQTWWRSHQARVFFVRWEQQYAGQLRTHSFFSARIQATCVSFAGARLQYRPKPAWHPFLPAAGIREYEGRLCLDKLRLSLQTGTQRLNASCSS